MSDEEREALRNFKGEYETCNYNSSDLIIELDDAKIILNLIESQQKEIEELKNTETYKIAIIDKYKYISKDKIKAKIKIRKEEKENCKDSIEEKYLLREIYVLQSLLAKED